MTEDVRLSTEAKADIQGFITSGYGHLPVAAYLIVEIRRLDSARMWLKDLFPMVTTSTSWRVQPEAPKVKPQCAVNLAITFAGLQALGLSRESLCSFPPEFRDGMASAERSRILGDTKESDPNNWELGGHRNPAIHVLLILHAPSREDMAALRDVHRSLIRRFGDGIIEHEGIAQEGERPSHGKEPFGFHDGIAQPDITGISGKGVNTGEFIMGYRNAYNFVAVSPVATAKDDPRGLVPPLQNPNHAEAGYRDFGLNGTFVVYRKLQQNVAGFWRFLQSESVRLKNIPDPEFMIWLAAKMVGRWPSGAPLVLAPLQDDPRISDSDEFLYADADSHGLACPLGAHIRRTNPRDLVRAAAPRESLHMTSRHRLLRRGKPYGPDLFDLTVLDHLKDEVSLKTIIDIEDDGRSRGIHFFCINTSIKSQFEFVQQAWANNPHFNGLRGNRDPLIGDNNATGDSSMHVPRHPVSLITDPLPRFVTVRGGAYFFMPGLRALRFLAE
jgi:Dyp-type peroxidase family